MSSEIGSATPRPGVTVTCAPHGTCASRCSASARCAFAASSPGASRMLTTARARGSRTFATSSVRGASMPSTATAGLSHERSATEPVPISSTPGSRPASARKVASSGSGASVVPVTRPGTATSPRSSCRVASVRQSAVSASPTGPAEHAGVRLPLQHRDLDRHVDQPAQARGQRRHVDGGVRRVRDDDDVAGQRVAVLLQQRGEGGGARLLLALDEQRDADGRPAPVGAQHREVGHDAGLVVGRAAAVEAPVALGGLERRGGPQVVAAGGLHVVVGVEQHGRGAGRRGPVRDHRRGAALGGDDPDVAAARVPRQRGDGLGAAPGVVGVRGVGPDARDADEAFEVGPRPRQDVGHRGGEIDGAVFSLVRHGADATRARAAPIAHRTSSAARQVSAS